MNRVARCGSYTAILILLAVVISPALAAGEPIKTYNDLSKTATISVNAVKTLDIQLLESHPDLTEFTEILQVTPYIDTQLDLSKDFTSAIASSTASNPVTGREVFLWGLRSFDYNTTVCDTVDTVKCTASHIELRTATTPDWIPLTGVLDLKAGVSLTIKVVLHKKAETGDVRINTILTVSSVEIPEFSWWNTSFLMKRTVQIIRNYGPKAEKLWYYPMNLTLVNRTGTSVNSTIYLGNTIEPDYDDIRFTNGDGTTSLDFWVDTRNTTTTSRVVWVELVQIPAAGTVVNIYWNYSVAERKSNADQTFLMYDDFPGTTLDTTKWDHIGETYGTIKVANSYVNISGSDTYRLGIVSQAVYGWTNFNLSIRYRWNYTVPINTGVLFGITDQKGSGTFWPATGDGANYYPYEDAGHPTGYNYGLSWVENSVRSTSGEGYGPEDIDNLNEITRNNTYINFLANASRTSSSSSTSNVFTGSAVGPRADMYSGVGVNGTLYIDEVMVRNYSVPQPVWGASGNEPVTAFSCNPTVGIKPVDVTGTDTSTYSPTSYYWSVENATAPVVPKTSTLKNPVFNMSFPGSYNVNMSATNAFGTDWENKTSYLNILNATAPDFVANVTPGAEWAEGDPWRAGASPLLIYFWDITSPSNATTPLYWNYSFGDGTWFNTSIAGSKNPSHTYTTTGNRYFTPTLYITNASGTGVLTKPNYIYVGPLPAPTFATLFANGTTALYDSIPTENIFFNVTNPTNGITEWYWDTGDGGWQEAFTPATMNFTHQFTVKGNYTTSLYELNISGWGSLVVPYNFLAFGIPVPDFTGTPASGPVTLTVQFDDTTPLIDGGPPEAMDEWDWSFGDGVWYNTTDPLLKNPAHNYIALGYYDVTLYIHNWAGWGHTTKPTYIAVMPYTQNQITITVAVTNNGVAAVGDTIAVYDEGTTGTDHSPVTTGSPLDDGGIYVFIATLGHYYEVTVLGHTYTYMASTANPTWYIQWKTPPSKPEWNLAWNETNSTIDMSYRSSGVDSVKLEIKDSGNGKLAFCRTYSASDLDVPWNPPSGTHNYQVRLTATRATGTVGGTNYITARVGAGAPQGTIPFLPIDPVAQSILLMMFLMVFCGLGGYVHAPIISLMTAIIAAWMNYIGWLMIPWYWVQLVLLVAFLAMFTRGPDV